MKRHGGKRKLTAILIADVAGYSRLMGQDEEGTLARIGALRKLIDPKITHHGGRIIKSMGDGALVEFTSVVEAVKCAAKTQTAIAECNSDVPEDRRISFRVGINLGDVIVTGDDIYGDGVNVAARIEELAEPGSIYISGTVYEHVRNKLDLSIEDLGEHSFKNINAPVRVYAVKLDSHKPPGSRTSTPLPFPDKPSIAVLPFVNMGGDPEQEYFSDGITEDIITELCRFRGLFVIARDSSFAFRGRTVDLREIGRQLGVRFVVEGSVRRLGTRLRITAQLIDAVTNSHVWAEHYDRDLEDIFAVQDEVTQAIVAAIEPELLRAERERARRKPPDSLSAWECYHRGLWHLYQYKAEESAKAQALFRCVVEFDPNFGSAHAALAYSLYYERVEGLVSASDAWLSRALEAARTAVFLDERDAFANMVLGRLLVANGEYEASIDACDSALAYNPNYADAHYGKALTLCFAGQPEAAIPEIDEALRLNPHDPGAWAFLSLRSLALTLLHRHDEALIWARKAVQRPNAPIWTYTSEAVALAHLARIDEARAALDRALTIKPDLSASFFQSVLPWKDPAHLEHYIDGLRKAGLTA